MQCFSWWNHLNPIASCGAKLALNTYLLYSHAQIGREDLHAFGFLGNSLKPLPFQGAKSTPPMFPWCPDRPRRSSWLRLPWRCFSWALEILSPPSGWSRQRPKKQTCVIAWPILSDESVSQRNISFWQVQCPVIRDCCNGCGFWLKQSQVRDCEQNCEAPPRTYSKRYFTIVFNMFEQEQNLLNTCNQYVVRPQGGGGSFKDRKL